MNLISSKAKTLINLSDKLSCAIVPELLYFKVKDWKEDKNDIVKKIKSKFNKNLAIRSSSLNEDCEEKSNAGNFESILNVKLDDNNIAEAVEKVISSYSKNSQINDNDEVLVQEMVENVIMSGVAFSCDPENLTPYFIINYSLSEDTTKITSGSQGSENCFIFYKNSPYDAEDKNLNKIIKLINELIALTGKDNLDIEFAIDENNIVYLLQARYIVRKGKRDLSKIDLLPALLKLEKKIIKLQKKNYNLLGDTTSFGVMPDWNPAEIIGIKPNPLSLSLYKELITDYIWANHRKSYGFRDLKSSPLLTSFFGMPYIDIRIDFNSWIPESLDDEISEKLVNFYINKFNSNQHYHDKVEFDIIFSCLTPSTEKKLKNDLNGHFSETEIMEIKKSLVGVTNLAVSQIASNMSMIEILKARQSELDSFEDIYIIDKIYWLVNDCKRFGTFPFAGLARSAFIAVDILNSFVESEIITITEKEDFIRSLHTISYEMKLDHNSMSKQDFLEKYGHLRPSTYDINSKNYSEGYDTYFSNKKKSEDEAEDKIKEFSFSNEQKEKINNFILENGFNFDFNRLFEFLKVSIAQREYSKFIFTKSLNAILELTKDLGQRNDISTQDMSFVSIDCILNLYHNIDQNSVKETLLKNIEYHRSLHEYTLSLKLPANITSPEDIYYFYNETSSINFITQNVTTSPSIIYREDQIENLKGKIVFIENADPGYDFLFIRGISGLITKYGGVNSHMAIRCSELGIPAAIGIGENKFNELKNSAVIELDCNKKMINIISN